MLPKAYYNAGSAALVLFLLAFAIGLFIFCRRRRRTGDLSIGTAEESIPLSQNVGSHETNEHDGGSLYKGKGRALESQTIFDVGEGSDDEGEYHDREDGRRK